MEINIKGVLLGPTGAGKTSLMKSYVRQSIHNVKATILFDVLSFNIKLPAGSVKRYPDERVTVKLTLHDTSGEPRFKQDIIPQCIKGAAVVIFVYDVTDPRSASQITDYFRLCNEHIGVPYKDYLPVLCANKMDLIMSRLDWAQAADISMYSDRLKEFHMQMSANVSPSPSDDCISSTEQELTKIYLRRDSQMRHILRDAKERPLNGNVNDVLMPRITVYPTTALLVGGVHAGCVLQRAVVRCVNEIGPHRDDLLSTMYIKVQIDNKYVKQKKHKCCSS